MNFFGNITSKVAGSLSQMMPTKKEIEPETEFEGMSQEELCTVATVLKDENRVLKGKYSEIKKENDLLKNSIINNSNEVNSKSQFGKLFNNFKTAFLTMDNNDNLNQNLNEFKGFLYNQFLFYGGINEDDVNFLNSIHITTDEEWNNNKDVFKFKQKIIENNYRELFRSMMLSNEINKMFKEEEKTKQTNNNNKEESQTNEKNNDIDNCKQTALEDILKKEIENEDENLDNFHFGGKQIKSLNEPKKPEEPKQTAPKVLQDILSSNAEEINFGEKKEEEDKKDKKNNTKANIPKFVEQEPTVISPSKINDNKNKENKDLEKIKPETTDKPKKQEKITLLDNLLLEDDGDDDNEEFTFSNMTKEKKNKGWNEED